ncbi:hypothetical protein P5673_000383 [Acropora cervicornis]|uniref:Uncharacterized protein n=1 Tax=Acropora cervicornis TaxID=6130 RepID=A0AAD9R726_ACRCE|nr:hypothetical protein P5673_000383 [Acropora cervicornis]
MASAQVVETSVTNNSPSEDSNHPDNLFQSRFLSDLVPSTLPFDTGTSIALFEEKKKGDEVPWKRWLLGVGDHVVVREFISYNGPDAFLLHLPTRSSYPGNECFQHGGHAVARNEVNGEKNDYFRIYLAGMLGITNGQQTSNEIVLQMSAYDNNLIDILLPIFGLFFLPGKLCYVLLTELYGDIWEDFIQTQGQPHRGSDHRVKSLGAMSKLQRSVSSSRGPALKSLNFDNP